MNNPERRRRADFPHTTPATTNDPGEPPHPVFDREEGDARSEFAPKPRPDEERGDTVSLPDAFADKTANTLDIATATIIQRIEGIEERCRRIKSAITNDVAHVKRQIHATIELATRAEQLAHSIDRELDAIVQERKTKLGA